MDDVQKFASPLIENIEKVIVGKRQAIEYILVALLCEGHVLLEDVPGSGKTMLARAIAASLGIRFSDQLPVMLENHFGRIARLKRYLGRALYFGEPVAAKRMPKRVMLPLDGGSVSFSASV